MLCYAICCSVAVSSLITSKAGAQMINQLPIGPRVSTTPRPDPVQSDVGIPDRAAVVVIGGGIIGTSTALALADKGIDVVLCEKGEIGAEQSSRNWGWCRTQGRDPREIQLSLEANRIWRGLNAKVQGETGFRAEGVVYLCSAESELAYYEAWLEKARIYQVDARMLSSAGGRKAPTRRHPHVARRHLLAERRSRRAAEGGTRDCQRRPPSRCYHTHPLRRARCRDYRGPGQRCRDRDGPHRHRYRRARWRRVVAPLLW